MSGASRVVKDIGKSFQRGASFLGPAGLLG